MNHDTIKRCIEEIAEEEGASLDEILESEIQERLQSFGCIQNGTIELSKKVDNCAMDHQVWKDEIPKNRNWTLTWVSHK